MLSTERRDAASIDASVSPFATSTHSSMGSTPAQQPHPQATNSFSSGTEEAIADGVGGRAGAAVADAAVADAAVTDAAVADAARRSAEDVEDITLDAVGVHADITRSSNTRREERRMVLVGRTAPAFDLGSIPDDIAAISTGDGGARLTPGDEAHRWSPRASRGGARP